MSKILFIGSSNIIEEHIKVAFKVGLKLYSINSTRQNSRNQKKIEKKYNFEKKFSSWKDAVNFAGNKKNISFLIAARIKDSESILKHCCKYNNKIFIEKPVTLNKKLANQKKHNNIFFGYNRIFFNLVNKIKKYNFNRYYCNVIISFKNDSNIRNNISHIISILLYLFGNLKLTFIIKNKRNKTIILKDKKKNIIIINLIETSSDNYSINIIKKDIHFLIKPLEILYIYKKLKFVNFQKNPKKLFVKLMLKSKSNEFYFNNFKPGFLNQMKTFKKFIKNRNFKIYNNFNFANRVTKICYKIIKS